MKWHGQDQLALLNAISARTAPTRRKVRRTGQSYEAFVNYLTSDEWELLVAKNPSGVKLRTLLDVCFGLGLRCATEPCLKLICTVWMLLDLSEPERRVLTSESKSAMTSESKSR